MAQRSKIGILVAEFFGTAILTSTILAEANSNVLVNRTWFIAATAGITLAVLTLAIGRTSRAHVNPAITIGLWTLRKIETTTAIAYIAAQVLGAAVALRLFQYLQGDLLANTAGKFDWRIFVAEAVGSFIFAFGVAAVVTQKLEGYKAAFGIGASFMLGILVASVPQAANGFLNPATALGNNSWSWTYVAAPVLGAVLGMNLYDLFLAPESSFKREVALKSSRTVETKKTTKKVAHKHKTKNS